MHYSKKTRDESINSIKEYFKNAENFVAKHYDIKGKKIRRIFIADFGLSKPFQRSLSDFGIEAIKLQDILIKYLNILHDLYPYTSHLGKEENNVTRILMFLSYSFKKELKACGLLKVKEKPKEIKKNAGTLTDPTITYQEAYSLFQDRQKFRLLSTW
jgi:hypothetical protein